MLRGWDRRGNIGFVDIAADGFDASTVGVSQADLMARIHGRLASGALIEGVEVFRQLYTAVGFGSLVSLTRIPGVSHVLDFAYTLFAKHRLQMTGRCTDGVCDASTV